MTTRIYHNPKCSTSRKALEMLRAAGHEPEIIDYQKNPPSRAELARLIADAGLTPREALRRRGTPYDELGLDNPDLGDDALLDAILKHPILLERPFVVTDKGTRLARPIENLAEIL